MNKQITLIELLENNLNPFSRNVRETRELYNNDFDNSILIITELKNIQNKINKILKRVKNIEKNLQKNFCIEYDNLKLKDRYFKINTKLNPYDKYVMNRYIFSRNSYLTYINYLKSQLLIINIINSVLRGEHINDIIPNKKLDSFPKYENIYNDIKLFLFDSIYNGEFNLDIFHWKCQKMLDYISNPIKEGISKYYN